MNPVTEADTAFPERLSIEMKHILCTLLFAALGAAALCAESEPAAVPESGVDFAKAMSQSFQAVSRKVIPSVVQITVRVGSETKPAQSRLPLFGDFFSEDSEKEKKLQSAGSGVLVDPSGIVLTNHHVIEDGGTVTAELYDGRRFGVKEIKKDPLYDLAVLILDAQEELPYLEFADSDKLEIGDWVLAIGNPFMLESSVSAGIISAKKRFLSNKDRTYYLQTDAAINPGNSGGPLVDLNGQVVGINTAIATLTGGYQGIGFAIPGNIARWTMKQLIEKGKVERAFIGFTGATLSYEESKNLGLPPREGVKIGPPFRNSPAAKAGLRTNDIILEFDGKIVDSNEMLRSMVECADIDQPHTLTILRKGETEKLCLPIKLEIRPDDYVGVPQTEQLVDRGKHYTDAKLGLMLIPMTDSAAERLGAAPGSGIVILSATPASPAYRAGLRDGMAILKMNGNPIHSIDDYVRVLAGVPSGAELKFEVIAKKEIREITMPAKP